MLLRGTNWIVIDATKESTKRILSGFWVEEGDDGMDSSHLVDLSTTATTKTVLYLQLLFYYKIRMGGKRRVGDDGE